MEPNEIQEEVGDNGWEGEEGMLGVGRHKKIKTKSNGAVRKRILVVERMKYEDMENLEGLKIKSVIPKKIEILRLKN